MNTIADGLEKATLRTLLRAYNTAVVRGRSSHAKDILRRIEARMEGAEDITIDGSYKAPDVVPKNVVPFTFS